MGKTLKARLNLTIDQDIYRDSRRVFSAMDMNMSAFMELSLSRFLETVRPLMPLLDEVERGERDPGDVKAAMRIWLAHSVGEDLSARHKVVQGEQAER